MDPRLYILGALALLSVVSIGYLLVAAVGFVVGARTARKAHASSAEESSVELLPTRVEPSGPAPVLESDPFAMGAPAIAEEPASAAIVGAEPALQHAGEAMRVSAETIEAHEQLPAASVEESERIAQLIASLEAQAEREIRSVGVADVKPSAVAPEGEEQPSLQTPAPSAADSLDYRLVASVELHFTEGEGRVGVRPGTRTHDEFVRLANSLLRELRALEPPGHQ
ncbi:MAG: hypothetical protein N3B11_06380 [Coriobacteriia bacterium]|nr:hypothetical protein [Coriobacteriia bacterium]